jgi:hypothetical protein
VTRAGVAGAEAAGVAGIEVRLLRRDPGTFRIGDAAIDLERCGLALERQRDRRLGVDGPGVEQVEVAFRRCTGGEAVGVGQAGGAVLGGEAGNVPGGADRLLDGRRREVGAAGIAAALPRVDGDADRLVAVALDVLGLALAHRHRQAYAFGRFGDCIARPQCLGRRERAFDEVTEPFARIGEVRRGERPGRRGHVGGGK